MMKTKVFTSSVVLAMGLAFSAQSQADTVSLGFIAPAFSKGGSTLDTTEGKVGAGELNRLVTASTSPKFTAGDTILAWCIDIATSLKAATYQVSQGNPTGTKQVSGAESAALKTLVNERIESVVDATSSAAFQLAVWEIIYEGNLGALDVATGAFSTTGPASVLNMAQSWLSALGTVGAPVKYGITYLYSPNPDAQELMHVSEVPLPGAALLFGSALLGAGVFGRKKMAAAKVAA